MHIDYIRESAVDSVWRRRDHENRSTGATVNPDAAGRSRCASNWMFRRRHPTRRSSTQCRCPKCRDLHGRLRRMQISRLQVGTLRRRTPEQEPTRGRPAVVSLTLARILRQTQVSPSAASGPSMRVVCSCCRLACGTNAPTLLRDERGQHSRFNDFHAFALPRHSQQHVDVFV